MACRECGHSARHLMSLALPDHVYAKEELGARHSSCRQMSRQMSRQAPSGNAVSICAGRRCCVLFFIVLL